MKGYLITVATGALLVTMVNLLSPQGERGGIARFVRLFTSLLLICIIASPLSGAAQALEQLFQFDFSFGEEQQEEYDSQMQELLDSASKDYVRQMLTKQLEERFSITAGQVEVRLEWKDGESKPTRATVILKDAAIWKNPRELQAFVEELLGCPCDTAIG